MTRVSINERDLQQLFLHWIFFSMNLKKFVGGIFDQLNFAAKLLRSFDLTSSVTRLGDLLDFGQLLKAFGNN